MLARWADTTCIIHLRVLSVIAKLSSEQRGAKQNYNQSNRVWHSAQWDMLIGLFHTHWDLDLSLFCILSKPPDCSPEWWHGFSQNTIAMRGSLRDYCIFGHHIRFPDRSQTQSCPWAAHWTPDYLHSPKQCFILINKVYAFSLLFFTFLLVAWL